MTYEKTLENGVFAARSVREGDKHVLRLSGELDLSGYEELNDELGRIEATDASRIVIDLSELEFLDSAGIRLLVEAYARSRADSNRLRLVRGKGAVQRALKLSCVEDKLPFAD